MTNEEPQSIRVEHRQVVDETLCYQSAQALAWGYADALQLMDSLADMLSDEAKEAAERNGLSNAYRALVFLQTRVDVYLDALKNPDEYDWTVLSKDAADIRMASHSVSATLTSFWELSLQVPSFRGFGVGARLTLLVGRLHVLAAQASAFGPILREVYDSESSPILLDDFLIAIPLVIEEEPDNPTSERPILADEDSSPPVPLPCLEGVHPIISALDRKKAQIGDVSKLTPTDEIHVYVNSGRYQGIAVDVKTWTPLPTYEPWWGRATMHIHGVPGRTWLKAVGGRGWSTTFEVQPSAKWEGRLRLHNFYIECSGGGAFDVGAYRSTNPRLLRDFGLVDCTLVDNPDPEVICAYPILAAQTSLTFERVRWSCWRSKGHAVFSRNPYGRSETIDCEVLAIGGEVWRETAKEEEGPAQDRGRTDHYGLVAGNFNLHPQSSGFAFSLLGAGRDWKILDSFIYDVRRDPSGAPLDGQNSHGALKATSRGGSHRLPSGYGNGRLDIIDTDFVFRTPDRAPLVIDVLEDGVLQDCGIYTTDGRAIELARTPGLGISIFKLSGCNTEMVRNRMVERLQKHAPDFNPDSLMMDAGIELGTDPDTALLDRTVRDGLELKNTELVS